MSSLDKNLGSLTGLRKPKLTDRIGWVKPNQTRFVKSEMNELLTPRRIVRHKKLRKFTVNNRTSCISALRMVNHEIKKWMRPTGGPLDLGNLNPKVICQIIAEWSTGDFNDKLPSKFLGKPLSQQIAMCGHRYSYYVNQKDRYYTEMDESDFTQYNEDSKETDKVIRLLLSVIKQKGGFASYMNESCLHRPDAMCAAAIHDGYARTWPLELGGCPGKICKFCGVCNIFSHRDHINKPLRSSNRHLPKNETYDDSYTTEETTWTFRDGKLINEHPIAWRCGFCFSDLSIKPLHSDFYGTSESIEYLVSNLIGGLLDQLTKINATDFYEDANADLKISIMEHDMAIVKRMLLKLYTGRLAMPTNTNQNQLSQLRKSVPHLTMYVSTKANSVNPSFVAELVAMTGQMRSIFDATVTNIDGSLIKLSDNSTTYSNYNNWLFPSNIITEPLTDNTKLFGPASLIRDINYFLSQANKLNGIYILMPLKDGLLNESLTSLKVHDDVMYLFVNGKTVPLILNASTGLYLNHDVISTNYGFHHIIELFTGNFFRLIYLTKLTTVPAQFLNWYDTDDNITITLPIPTMIEMVEGKLKIGVKCIKSTLNQELFRALCIRNIQGKMEFNALCQYAIAFNMRRYTTGKVILKMQHIDYSIIHFHVFACLYTMKLQNNRMPYLKMIYETFNSANLTSLIADVANSINSTFSLSESTQSLISLIDSSSELLLKGAVPESFQYLHSAIRVKSTRTIRIAPVSLDVTPNFTVCPHCTDFSKLDLVPDGCKCCGTKTNKEYCDMCSHKDYSSLIWGYTIESALSQLVIKLSNWLKTEPSKLKPIDESTKVIKYKDSKDYKKQSIKVDTQPLSKETITVSKATNNLLLAINSALKSSKTIIDINANLDSLTTTLLTEENTEELMNVLDPSFVHMVLGTNVDMHNMSDCSICLPFVGSEYIIMENCDITETNIINLPNSDVNSCGYEAFQYLFKSNFSLQDFKVLVNASEPAFDESQLFYVAEHLRVNLALYCVVDQRLMAVTNNFESNIYMTMGYVAPKDSGLIGHFYPVQLKINRKLNYYYCEPTVPKQLRGKYLHDNKLDMWLTLFDKPSETNLSVELSLKLFTMANTSDMPNKLDSQIIDNKVFILNNKLQNIEKSLFNFELILCPELADYITLKTSNLDHKLFKSTLTVPAIIPQDLTQLHRLHTINEIFKIAKTQNDILQQNLHTITYLKQNLNFIDNYLLVDLTGMYVKPMDIVGIKHKHGGVGIARVLSSAGNTAIIENLNVTDDYTLLIPKNSVMSNIKRISALQSASRDGLHLQQLLQTAYAVNGYAGSGKSADILRRSDANSMALTNTTIAKSNLINRGYSRRLCMTLERATWDLPNNVNHIQIDEANMIEYIDLSLIVNDNIEKLSLYYDDSQIGKFDTVELQGLSMVHCITNYPLNTIKWNYSTRFGGQLTKGLRALLPDLDLNDKKNTILKFENVDKLTKDKLKDLVFEHYPLIILNPYTMEVNTINNWLRELAIEHDNFLGEESKFGKITAFKSHSFQSYEATRVMFVQWRQSSSDMGLCRNRKYVISSCTRATEYLVVVSAGFSRSITNLRDCVSIIGGNINTLRDHLDKDLEATSLLLNECLKFEMITTKVNNNTLELYRGNMYVGKYEKHTVKGWIGVSHIPMVGKRLNDALVEEPGKSVKHVVPNAVTEQLNLLTRVRALCWINDMIVNNGKFHLGGSLAGLVIKKGAGCPLMCNLSVLINKRLILHVSDGWSSLDFRALSYDEQEPEAVRFRNWLRGDLHNSWLDQLNFDSRLDSYMMVDRALTLPFAALQLSQGQTKLSVDTSNENSFWKNLVLQKHNKSSDNRWHSSIRHTMLIHESKFSSRLTGKWYTLMSMSLKKNFSTWSKEDVWIDVFNAALSSVKPIMRKHRAIGTTYGMYLDPETHIMRDTIVGKYLKEKKFEEDLRLSDAVHSTINVSSMHHGTTIELVNRDKLITNVMMHNATTLTNCVSETVDSYLLAAYGTQGENVSIGYYGLNSHLTAVTNRHYIEIVRPSNNFESLWLPTVEVTRQWFNAFTDRLHENLQSKAEALQLNLHNLSDDQKDLASAELTKLSNLSKEPLKLTPLSKPRDFLLLGTFALSLEIQDLEVALSANRTVIMCYPLQLIDFDLTNCGLNNVSCKPCREIYKATQNSCLITENMSIRFNLLDTIGEFGIYSLYNSPKPNLINLNSSISQNPFVTLEVPFIKFTNLATTDPILTTQHMKVDKRIIDRCLNYCIANRPNTDGILAYIRSLLSTYDTNRTGIFPTYNASIEVAYNSAIAALTLYQYNLNGILSLTSLTNSHSELLRIILTIQNIINKNEALSDLLTGVVERNFSTINIDLRKLATCVSDIEVKMKTPSLNIKYINTVHKQEISTPSDDDNNDDDFPDDDDSESIDDSSDGTSSSNDVSSHSSKDSDSESAVSSQSSATISYESCSETDSELIEPISTKRDLSLQHVKVSKKIKPQPRHRTVRRVKLQLVKSQLHAKLDSHKFSSQLSAKSKNESIPRVTSNLELNADDASFFTANQISISDIVDTQQQLLPSDQSDVNFDLMKPIKTIAELTFSDQNNNVRHYLPEYCQEVSPTITTEPPIEIIVPTTALFRSKPSISTKKKKSTDDKPKMQAKIANVHDPSNAFDSSLLNHITLDQIYNLIGDKFGPDNYENNTVWVVWELNPKSEVNKFVDKCLLHNKQIVKQLIVINSSTESTFIPPLLLEFKQFTTVQCWSDVVRMWLLMRFGGVWLDASVILDPTYDNPLSYLHYTKGRLFFQKLEDNQFVLDNWMMVVQSNLDFIKVWFKILMTIIRYGNNIRNAMPHLNLLVPGAENYIDVNETYLTMHQASRLALRLEPLPNFIMDPGFSGPLGWITGPLNMAEWIGTIINKSYVMQGGANKMIGLSRDIVSKWEKENDQNYLNVIVNDIPYNDVLIVGCGTKGDILTMRGLAKLCNDNDITSTKLNISTIAPLQDELHIPVSIDLLDLSNVSKLEDIDKSLNFIADLYVSLVELIHTKKFKYVIANYSIPCMMQICRLTGAMPINLTAMPTFESINDGSFITMSIKNERLMSTIVDSLTLKISKDKNLPWVSDELVNGKHSMLTLRNCNRSMISSNRHTTNTYVVGSLIDGKDFDSTDTIILPQQLTNKIDVLLPGPAVNKFILTVIVNTIKSTNNRSKILLVIDNSLFNLTAKRKSSFFNDLKAMYLTVKVIPSLNIYTLHNLVNKLFSHGGQNTVTDGININATNVMFGKYVDQPYWKDVNIVPNVLPPDNVLIILRKQLNKPFQPLPYNDPINYSKINNMELVNYTISRGTCASEITFVPIDIKHCVKYCFESYFKEHLLSWNTLMDLNTYELMSKEQVIELSFLANLNLAIVYNAEYEHHFWFKHSKTITLELTDSQQLLHCNRCTMTKINVTMSNIAPKLDDSAPFLVANELIGDNNETTRKLQSMLTTGTFVDLANDSCIGNKFLHSINSSNLISRLERVARPAIFTDVISHFNRISIINSIAPVHGKLYLIAHSAGINYGIVVKCLNSSVKLITDTAIAHRHIMMLDLGCSLIMKTFIQSMRGSVSEIYHPLNQSTKQYLQTITTTVEYDTRLANSNDENVVVYNFDNRGHDKYDEAEVLSNAKCIHWVGIRPTNKQLQEFKDTYNKSIRLIYYQGNSVWRFDANSPNDLFLLKALAISRDLNYVVSRGIIFKEQPLQDDVTYISSILSAEVDSRFKINNNKLSFTKEEWITLTNINASMFEIFSSACLTEIDGLYHGFNRIDLVRFPSKNSLDDLTTNGYSVTGRTYCFLANTRSWIVKPRQGGEAFSNEEKISLGNSKDWWNKIGTESVILKDLQPNPLSDVMTNGQQTLNDSNWGSNFRLVAKNCDEPIADEEIDFCITADYADMGAFAQITPSEIQNMWVNTDLSMDLRQYAPINAGTIRSKENPDKIITSTKILLNELYPMESRPVLTKWTFEEHRSIAGRLFSKLKLRNPEKTISTSKRLALIVNCYFDEGFVAYQEPGQLLDVDAYETMVWISKRKDGLKIAQELNELFTSELGVIPLNAINVHMKLESLMKENPIKHWGEQQARAIYWQRKAIAAISSPIFLKVKTRLKNSLKSKFMYADGLTPKELNQKCRNTTNVNWFFENDLSKQDRQTDKFLIDVEMELYKLLGVSESVIVWWRTMHENWKFKARWNRGYASEMRLTGQSTTSLGNLITNMQVHCDFILRNFNSIKLVFMLGDDILILLTDKPSISSLPSETKLKHNMTSKQKLSENSGIFCCMICYKNYHGSCEMGPDYVRLKYRFEVTNGVSEATPENIEARCQSYACMLGNTAEMKLIKRAKNWTIPLEDWYDQDTLIPSLAVHYDLSEFDIVNNYKLLTNYINNPTPTTVDFSIYKNVKVY